MNFSVTVTKEHFYKFLAEQQVSQAPQADYCPVAQAVKALFPKDAGVSAHFRTVQVHGTTFQCVNERDMWEITYNTTTGEYEKVKNILPVELRFKALT